MVMPIRIGSGRYRVANARAMSWVLSPSSATKITPKLMRNAWTHGGATLARLVGPSAVRSVTACRPAG